MADKEDIDKEKPIKPLDAEDIALLKSYVRKIILRQR